MDNSGRKDDSEKLRLDLVPYDAVNAIAEILTFGAKKYGDRNWERGMKWSRVFAALQRHLTAWWEGEDRDSETGLSHLWHAGCCAAFLIAYERRQVGEDDRPKTAARPKTILASSEVPVLLAYNQEEGGTWIQFKPGDVPATISAAVWHFPDGTIRIWDVLDQWRPFTYSIEWNGGDLYLTRMVGVTS